MAENSCVVCFKNFRIYSVGECDHPVCFECSTRMRVLCGQKECPMCRHEMEKVVFTERVRPFKRLNKTYALYDKKYRIAFENDHIRDVFESLLHYVCRKCQRTPIFDTFEILKEHMKRVHDLFCCDLCAENLKIFPDEMRYYTKSELSRHQRIGDVDDRSHRGHPLCEFCRVRYLDRDELYKHLRKEHFFCHICDGEGIQQFYGSYVLLRDHYREKHYLCEEGTCIGESMTSVFPTEIDLKAHKALVHFKNSRNKLAVRQARTLDLEFTLPPRNNERRPRYGQEGYIEDFSGEQSTYSQEDDVNLMSSMEQHFPTLGNSSAFHAPRPKFVRESNNRLTFNDQNFPALGSEVANSVNPSSSSSSIISTTNTSVKIDHKKQKERKSKNVKSSDTEASASTLSLTWVKKAKERPAIEKIASSSAGSSSDVLAKPPTMNRKNFPNLQKNALTEGNVCSNIGSNKTKKNKKSAAVVFEIDESSLPITRVNYSEAIVKNPAIKEECKKSTNNASNAAVSVKKVKEERSLNLNKDNKTHSFLLNANRKKVKMKPEELIPLNDPSINRESLPRQSVKSSNLASSSYETQRANGTSIAYNKKSNNTDEKIRSKVKETKPKEKQGKPLLLDSELGVKKTKQVNPLTKNNISSKNNIKVETKNKKENVSNKNESSSESLLTSKPPPGFEKPSVSLPPPPPPGFDRVITASEDKLLSDPAILNEVPFVYQQPNRFAERNSQLIEKVGNSLVQHGEEELNKFKNMSLLFREGFVSASDYYLYCIQSIEVDKFEDVFFDLIALLPDIFKQQELWAIHQTTTPLTKTRSSSSPIDYCTICFQIMKLDDATVHYSNHGISSDVSLQCSSLRKY